MLINKPKKSKRGIGRAPQRLLPVTPGERSLKVGAQCWGQLEPLDELARQKIERWGDRLPRLVDPDLAGRFEGAYEALRAAVAADDIIGTHKLVKQLMRAWGVLERAAEDAGHKPLEPHAYAVELDAGKIVAFAQHGWAELRLAEPGWVVYSFEDAARVLVADFSSRFIDECFSSFPNASVVEVTGGLRKKLEIIEDEIPF